MSATHSDSTDQLVDSILDETRLNSSDSIDSLTRRVSRAGDHEGLVSSLAGKNPALLGAGEVS